MESNVYAGRPGLAAPARPTVRRTAPALLADVALIDGPGAAAGACMSIAQFLELVRTGRAPQPVIKQPRFTRWRLADVRQWLIDSARGVATDTATVTRAKRASSPASIKRRATTSVGE